MFQLFRDIICKTWKKFKKIDATKNNSDNNEKDNNFLEMTLITGLLFSKNIE